MEAPTRLILVPQLPVKMRYQEWWVREFTENLAPHFDEIKVLGCTSKTGYPMAAKAGGFSVAEYAIQNELDQIHKYMRLGREWGSATLLHLDLSYPGIFHSVLAHKKPKRSVVFCHATSLNKLDTFEPIRSAKWDMEKGAAGLYDKVLVATQYHKNKLDDRGFDGCRMFNVRTMGALPYPPKSLRVHDNLPSSIRPIHFASVARPTPQKVDPRVEEQLYKMNNTVTRLATNVWEDYYEFLGESQFLIVTSKEETYGYQIVDAVLQGCIPIAPNAYSYPELLPSRLLYNQKRRPEEQALEIIHIAEEEQRNPQPVTLLCEQAAQNFWTNLVKELKDDKP